jgi:hypothetical protein
MSRVKDSYPLFWHRCRIVWLLFGNRFRWIRRTQVPGNGGDDHIRPAISEQTGAQSPLVVGMHQVTPPATFHQFRQDDRDRTAWILLSYILNGAQQRCGDAAEFGRDQP